MLTQKNLWQKSKADEEVELSDDAEFQFIERKLGRSPFTIYPDAFWIPIWDLLTYLNAIYMAFRIPFFLAFETETDLSIVFYSFQICSEYVFFVDIVIKFNKGFYG